METGRAPESHSKLIHKLSTTRPLDFRLRAVRLSADPD